MEKLLLITILENNFDKIETKVSKTRFDFVMDSLEYLGVDYGLVE